MSRTLTPEGRVKAKVNKLLDDPRIYPFMPVQNGMGAAGLDYHCVVCWPDAAEAFFVETKAPGKKPSGRQEVLIERLRGMGCQVFVIDGDEGLNELRGWLNKRLGV